jgi:hypothetical protein
VRPNFNLTAVARRSVARDRMLASALNFAIGFFGYPFENQYQQLITIEHNGVTFNNARLAKETDFDLVQ